MQRVRASAQREDETRPITVAAQLHARAQATSGVDPREAPEVPTAELVMLLLPKETAAAAAALAARLGVHPAQVWGLALRRLQDEADARGV